MLRLRSSVSCLAVFALAGLAGCAEAAPPPASPPPPPPPAPSSAVVAPPPPVAKPAVRLSFDEEYRQLLDQMVRVDTSHGNETKLLEPIAALFRDEGIPVQLLESSPGRGNLVARIKGNGSKRPMILLAHVDVVPVEGQPWTVPPFALTEKDGFLWGRGVNDDKGMAAAIVAIALELARSHQTPTRDVIVALTAGEETGGIAGARWLVESHKELLDAEIALNEGGGELLADDLSRVVAINLGVSEKLFQTFRLVVKGKGGHSSQPPTTGDPVVTLAHALLKVGSYRFAPHLLPEAKAAFASELATAEPEYVAALRRAVASAPKIAAADEAILAKNAAYNSQMRTTCVTTMLKGSPQDNVLPTTAEATVNCRLLPGETVAEVQAALARVIGDEAVAIVPAPGNGEGPRSPFEGEVIDVVKKVGARLFPDAAVLPSMTAGATDSRYLRSIGVHAYGVSPGAFTHAEAKAGHAAHGADERRSVKWTKPAVDYFRDVVRTLAL